MIWEVNNQIQAIVTRDKRIANDANYTLALLLPFFATGNALPIDYLPYPPPKTYLDAETAQVIRKLMALGKLNRKVVSVLGGMGLLEGLTKH